MCACCNRTQCCKDYTQAMCICLGLSLLLLPALSKGKQAAFCHNTCWTHPCTSAISYLTKMELKIKRLNVTRVTFMTIGSTQNAGTLFRLHTRFVFVVGIKSGLCYCRGLFWVRGYWVFPSVFSSATAGLLRNSQLHWTHNNPASRFKREIFPKLSKAVSGPSSIYLLFMCNVIFSYHTYEVYYFIWQSSLLEFLFVCKTLWKCLLCLCISIGFQNVSISGAYLRALRGAFI